MRFPNRTGYDYGITDNIFLNFIQFAGQGQMAVALKSVPVCVEAPNNYAHPQLSGKEFFMDF